ncbi:hypothetical protein F5887DRAFT_174563 [Amanita rubescens]|nr:hypothetical protein F5887DRAFT_174563 [Amanita rubescens]
MSDYKIPPGSDIHLVRSLLGGGCAELEGTRMGIAAGGQIQQKIYKDNKRANIYDEDARERVWIHTVSTDLWESITGVITPITPIVPGTYKEYDYPWFDLYDEHLQELQPTGRFRNLRSVRQLDTASPSRSSDLPDPTNPPHCSTHDDSQSGCVFRPCGHYGCEGCVGWVMGGNECPVCGRSVARMVGYQKPIPRVNVGAGSEEDFEEKIEGIPVHAKSEAASVVTLILNEDIVSRLSGATV